MIVIQLQIILIPTVMPFFSLLFIPNSYVCTYMTTYSDGQHDNSTTIISDIRCAKNTKGFNGKDGNEKQNPCSENDLCSMKRNSEKEKKKWF